MTDDQSQRIEALFDAAMEREPSERAAFLEEACEGDIELLAAVRRLVEASEGATEEVAEQLAGDAALLVPDAHAERRIGPYRLLGQLGEGGFGVVYLAERREPHVQRVALKVIKPGMDSKAVIARFEQERQALAVMDHPNVARVLDSGVTDEGRPYFVMEHVKGEPITDHCDRERLSIRQRLQLFVQVCEAIQHAHTKGVIHRDIKPSNILVASAPETGDQRKPSPGIPKVIDFGVAKAISHIFTGKTIFTDIGHMIGTPEYMSPEQAEMGEKDIDTRSDVYSLGVLLYELLTGALPFDPKELRDKAYIEIQRIIREVDPPKPSTRLTSLGDAGKTTAINRRARVDELAGQLRRELEWIPLRAMRKSRDERYRTALDLADDVRNYLEGRPLIAGPESAIYRARKFVRRNRGPVAASSVIAAAVVSGVIVSTALWLRAEAERDRAQAAEATVRDQLDESRVFVNSVLDEVVPGIRRLSGGAAVRQQILESLQAFVKRIGVGDALLLERAKALLAVGDLSGGDLASNLGESQMALDAYEEAHSILAQLRSRQSNAQEIERALAKAKIELAEMLQQVGGAPDRVETLLREGLEIRRRLAETTTADASAVQEFAWALINMAELRDDRGAVEDALGLYDEALRTAWAGLAASPGDQRLFGVVASAQIRLGYASVERGDDLDAAERYDEAVAIRRRQILSAPTDSTVQGALAAALYYLSDPLSRLDRLDEAESLLREAREIRQGLVDDDIRAAGTGGLRGVDDQALLNLLYIEMALADLYLWSRDDSASAIPEHRRTAQLARELAQRDPSDRGKQFTYGSRLMRLGEALGLAGETNEAIQTVELSLTVLAPIGGGPQATTDEAADLAWAWTVLGVVRREAGQAWAAVEAGQHAVQLYRALDVGSDGGLYLSLDFAEALAELAASRWGHSGAASESCPLIDEALVVVRRFDQSGDAVAELRDRLETERAQYGCD